MNTYRPQFRKPKDAESLIPDRHLSRHCVFYSIIWQVFVLLCFNLTLCQADEFEQAIAKLTHTFYEAVVTKHQKKAYNIVVRSFVDSQTAKRAPISDDIEDTLMIQLTEKFRNQPNIKVLERKRLNALEKEIYTETDGINFQLNGWQKKLGRKIDAGFLIMGTFRPLSYFIVVRAKLIDIISGEVIAGESVKIRLGYIDRALLKGIDAYELHPPPAESSASDQATDRGKTIPPKGPPSNNRFVGLRFLPLEVYDPKNEVWDLPAIPPPARPPGSPLTTIASKALGDTATEACVLAKTKSVKTFFNGRRPTNDYYKYCVYRIYCNVLKHFPNNKILVEVIIDFYKGRSG